jgi:hypothetical protein
MTVTPIRIVLKANPRSSVVALRRTTQNKYEVIHREQK